jgi:glutamine amidotransferase-like uncharacterized protein
MKNMRSQVRLYVQFITIVLAPLVGTCPYAFADEKPLGKPIRVAIFADAGVTEKAVPQVMKCLPESKGFDVKKITAKKIRAGDLKDFDLLIHPGGAASKQGSTLGEDGRAAVKRFVERGGGFIGICAGAYLASAEYPWSLGLLDAHVLDRAHWARGQGNVELKLSSLGQSALTTDKEVCTIHFENGPLLGPGEKDDIEDYEALASFETEIRDNGAPVGAMKGTTAIARGKFGKGRVVCFSPHPEKTPGRESFLQSAVRWAAGDYDSATHHQSPRNPNNSPLRQPQRGESQ